MTGAAIETLVRNIREALSRGDAARAEALCRECVALDPVREDALAFLAMRAIERGEPGRVREALDRATTLAPGAAMLHFHHGCVLEALAAPDEARDAFARAVAADPDMLLAQFWLGALEDATGRRDDALAIWVRAVASADRAGFGAQLAQQPPAVRTRVLQAVARVNAARADAIDAAIAASGASPSSRVRRAFDRYLGCTAYGATHPLQKPTFLLIPDLPGLPWHERGSFPELDAIEAETAAIRDELMAVLASDAPLAPYVDIPDAAPAASHWRELNRSPRWSAMHFHRHGARVDANAARCPRTVAALESLPLMQIPEHSPETLYSVLRPRTRIPPHTGVMNGRLTVHLPLIVPPNCGALCSGGEMRPWHEGRCLVFDDSHIHEAANDSDHTRVVLIFDLWDPRLTADEREALSAGIAAIGRFHRRHDAYDATHE